MIIYPPTKSLKVIDNFIDDVLIKLLRNLFLKLPHYYGHSSVKGTGTAFYNSDLPLDDTMVKYLCEKIQRAEGAPIRILRVYFNVQHSGMDGEWHEDDGDTTYLLMVTKTLKPGNGCFEIKEDNKIKKVDFVQNRLVYFNATTPHRGRCEKKQDNEPRITLAFKTERT